MLSEERTTAELLHGAIARNLECQGSLHLRKPLRGRGARAAVDGTRADRCAEELVRQDLAGHAVDDVAEHTDSA